MVKCYIEFHFQIISILNFFCSNKERETEREKEIKAKKYKFCSNQTPLTKITLFHFLIFSLKGLQLQLQNSKVITPFIVQYVNY
jgi:hypothetical protein